MGPLEGYVEAASKDKPMGRTRRKINPAGGSATAAISGALVDGGRLSEEHYSADEGDAAGS